MSNSFVRKIVYIIIIAVLLIPLSMITRPSVKNQNEGGVLARLRVKHNLSQAELSEIDPASETMKLASLGLRGVAVNMLWMQAVEHKKREEYDALASNLKALTKLQPNFVKVWEYQAHNLAYNVSMEFDDYEYRREWVNRGLLFMKQGVKHNRKDHRITDMLGFMTGNKYGKSDEKRSFRRLFKDDTKFHLDMSDMIDPESYDVDVFGPDSWLMARQWYKLSNNLVDTGAQMFKNDVMFFQLMPAQTRNRGLSLQTEHKTDDVIQDVWIRADKQWKDFGAREIRNSYGLPFQLSAGKLKDEKIVRLREDLDILVPGKRDELIEEIKADFPITAEQKMLLDTPADQRTEQQQREADKMLAGLQKRNNRIDLEVAEAASEENKLPAIRIAKQINELIALEKSESRDGQNINFTFWSNRNEAESQPLTVKARQLLHDAQQMRRRSIYDDEYEIDYVTKKKSNIRKGAISLYQDAFAAWSEVLKGHPNLQDGPLSDDMVKEIFQYRLMMEASNTQWPNDFPLQWLIDLRSKKGEMDKLPTTEELQEYNSGRM